jgi:hypothetical protein
MCHTSIGCNPYKGLCGIKKKKKIILECMTLLCAYGIISRKVTSKHRPKHQEGHLAKLKAPRYPFTILLVPQVLMETIKLPKREVAYGFSHLCQLRAPTKFRGCPLVFALVLRSHLSTSVYINFLKDLMNTLV